MKKLLLFVAIITLSQSLDAQYLDTVRILATGMDGTVAISSDDAEQKNAEMDKLYDDDLDMGWEGDEFNIVITGLRFQNVNVPAGAVIDSAFVEIFAHEDEGDPAMISVWGEASDNPETYNLTDLITDRPKTTAEIDWTITEEWAIWQPYRSPDLKTVIQEIVDRQGWQAGNSLALVFSGEDQGASDLDNGRDFESLENVEDPDDGGDGLNHPERIPKLYIYYSTSSSTGNLPIALLPAVVPNPVSSGNSFQIDLALFEGEDITIRLNDISGKIISSWKSNTGNIMELNIPAELAPGIYQLEVVSQTKRAVTKICVQ